MGTNAQPGEVRLTIPADGAYVAVPRSVVGNLAARNDFTLDAIDDLRIAVDEACALLLPQASDGMLECVFTIEQPTTGGRGIGRRCRRVGSRTRRRSAGPC